jgi:hypothetical protein
MTAQLYFDYKLRHGVIGLASWYIGAKTYPWAFYRDERLANGLWTNTGL